MQVGRILLCTFTLAAALILFANAEDQTDIEDEGQRQASPDCLTKSSDGSITCSGLDGTNEKCCNGRCTTKNGPRCSCSRPREACKSAADCCKPDWKCTNGKCDCGGTDDTVSSSKSCCSGEASSKKCKCSTKSYCDSDLDCCKGTYCEDTGIDVKKCKNQREIGKKCQRGVQCASGVCSGSTCACAKALGPCLKKEDCCPLPGKPPEAVGCVLGSCTDCVPSSVSEHKELQAQVCPTSPSAHIPSEACCRGQCNQGTAHVCRYPMPTGGYCTTDDECNFVESTCVDSKCKQTKCLTYNVACSRDFGATKCCVGLQCDCKNADKTDCNCKGK